MPAFQVTLTNANTNYDLLTLVRAIDAAFVDAGDMVVQADDDGGAQIYLFGDASLGATRYGQLMHAGDFTAHLKNLLGWNVRCDTAGKKVNILINR